MAQHNRLKPASCEVCGRKGQCVPCSYYHKCQQGRCPFCFPTILKLHGEEDVPYDAVYQMNFVCGSCTYSSKQKRIVDENVCVVSVGPLPGLPGYRLAADNKILDGSQPQQKQGPAAKETAPKTARRRSKEAGEPPAKRLKSTGAAKAAAAAASADAGTAREPSPKPKSAKRPTERSSSPADAKRAALGQPPQPALPAAAAAAAADKPAPKPAAAAAAAADQPAPKPAAAAAAADQPAPKPAAAAAAAADKAAPMAAPEADKTPSKSAPAGAGAAAAAANKAAQPPDGTEKPSKQDTSGPQKAATPAAQKQSSKQKDVAGVTPAADSSAQGHKETGSTAAAAAAASEKGDRAAARDAAALLAAKASRADTAQTSSKHSSQAQPSTKPSAGLGRQSSIDAGAPKPSSKANTADAAAKLVKANAAAKAAGASKSTSSATSNTSGEAGQEGKAAAGKKPAAEAAAKPQDAAPKHQQHQHQQRHEQVKQPSEPAAAVKLSAKKQEHQRRQQAATDSGQPETPKRNATQQGQQQPSRKAGAPSVTTAATAAAAADGAAAAAAAEGNRQPATGTAGRKAAAAAQQQQQLSGREEGGGPSGPAGAGSKHKQQPDQQLQGGVRPLGTAAHRRAEERLKLLQGATGKASTGAGGTKPAGGKGQEDKHVAAAGAGAGAGAVAQKQRKQTAPAKKFNPMALRISEESQGLKSKPSGDNAAAGAGPAAAAAAAAASSNSDDDPGARNGLPPAGDSVAAVQPAAVVGNWTVAGKIQVFSANYEHEMPVRLKPAHPGVPQPFDLQQFADNTTHMALFQSRELMDSKMRDGMGDQGVNARFAQPRIILIEFRFGGNRQLPTMIKHMIEAKSYLWVRAKHFFFAPVIRGQSGDETLLLDYDADSLSEADLSDRLLVNQLGLVEYFRPGEEPTFDIAMDPVLHDMALPSTLGGTGGRVGPAAASAVLPGSLSGHGLGGLPQQAPLAAACEPPEPAAAPAAVAPAGAAAAAVMPAAPAQAAQGEQGGIVDFNIMNDDDDGSWAAFGDDGFGAAGAFANPAPLGAGMDFADADDHGGWDIGLGVGGLGAGFGSAALPPSSYMARGGLAIGSGSLGSSQLQPSVASGAFGSSVSLPSSSAGGQQQVQQQQQHQGLQPRLSQQRSQAQASPQEPMVQQQHQQNQQRLPRQPSNVLASPQEPSLQQQQHQQVQPVQDPRLSRQQQSKVHALPQEPAVQQRQQQQQRQQLPPPQQQQVQQPHRHSSLAVLLRDGAVSAQLMPGEEALLQLLEKKGGMQGLRVFLEPLSFPVLPREVQEDVDWAKGQGMRVFHAPGVAPPPCNEVDIIVVRKQHMKQHGIEGTSGFLQITDYLVSGCFVVSEDFLSLLRGSEGKLTAAQVRAAGRQWMFFRSGVVVLLDQTLIHSASRDELSALLQAVQDIKQLLPDKSQCHSYVRQELRQQPALRPATEPFLASGLLKDLPAKWQSSSAANGMAPPQIVRDAAKMLFNSNKLPAKDESLRYTLVVTADEVGRLPRAEQSHVNRVLSNAPDANKTIIGATYSQAMRLLKKLAEQLTQQQQQQQQQPALLGPLPMGPPQ